MSGALDGLRVVDFGQYVAGPLVARMLADHGADVVRIDPPGGPRWRHPSNAVLQRGKDCLELDFTGARDTIIAQQLLAHADILIENFRPGVMERLQLGAQAMMQANPRLIYCSIPGFAADDSRAPTFAHEGVISAAAGVYGSRDGAPDEQPIFNTLPLASCFGALIAANSIVAALIARARTGLGQRVEVSLFEACFELTRYYGDRVPGAPYPRLRLGATSAMALTQHYVCKDGRYVHLSWLEGRQLDAFARVTGLHAEWSTAGLLDHARVRGDRAYSERLRGVLADVFTRRTAAEWMALANPDADLAECLTAEEWLTKSEQARVTGAVIELEDPELGLTQQAGYPISMTETPPRTRGARRRVADVNEALRRWDVPNWRISADAERIHDATIARDAVGSVASVDAQAVVVADAKHLADGMRGGKGYVVSDAAPLQGSGVEGAQRAGGGGGAESRRPGDADAEEPDGTDRRNVVDAERRDDVGADADDTAARLLESGIVVGAIDALGRDRADLYRSVGDRSNEHDSDARHAEQHALRHPLQGIRAIDLTQILAGPTACRILAEYGADVVQIANPRARAGRDFHFSTNNGKRSIVLDLKQPGAMDVFWKLLDQADVVSTNFSSEVGARLGVDEASVRRRRPDVIYSRISAYGLDGPLREFRGHDQVGQAVTGMETRWGGDGQQPLMQPHPLNDFGTGQLAAFGIMLALFHRVRTGQGQLVGASLAQTATFLQVPYMLAYPGKRWSDDPGGQSRLGATAHERLFRARDRWLFVAAHSMQDLLHALEAAAPTELEGAFALRSAAEWVARLTALGIGAAVLVTPEEAMRDDWAVAHGVSRSVEFPSAGAGTIVGPSARLSTTPTRAPRPAGPIGWDGREVLEQLGLGDDVAELVASGAVVLTAEQPLVKA